MVTRVCKMNTMRKWQGTGTRFLLMVYTITLPIMLQVCLHQMPMKPDDALTDGELTQSLAKMSDDARVQAVDDHPELARCITQTVDRKSNTNQEDDQQQFFDPILIQPDESLHHPCPCSNC